MICKKPDKDVPKIMCGHLLPCPHHTVVIDLSETKPINLERLGEITGILKKSINRGKKK